VNKQTAPHTVQTGVQTGVQTDLLSNLTVMERAIVWALLNSEMRLSYEDIAALLGKDKSTIRGQINTIKQKNEGIILESREVSGKKRLYVPDEIRSMIIKSVKVKIKGSKSAKNLKSES
jgi:chromosome segregation and condensation protein ScpB